MPRVVYGSLSFNNDGPLGSFFRYICDNGTSIVSYEGLFDGKGTASMSRILVRHDGVELQDREFFSANHDRREPVSGVARLVSTDETLDRLERYMTADR